MRILTMAIALALGTVPMPTGAFAQQVERGDRNILDMVGSLKPGQYIWAPELGDGPALVIVNLETQRLVLFRNGVPVAASTVSSGKTGHETPTGVFSILQKNADHRSSTYNNAPMPNMQRLTRRGIALHAGDLPGYPASHGCVRLPLAFSRLLFGATKLGMTVVITSVPAVPSDSDGPDLTRHQAAGLQQANLNKASYEWNPVPPRQDELVSVVISTADQRAIVFQGDRQIGSAPVRVSGQGSGATAYVLKSWDQTGKHWLKLQFSGAGGAMEVGPEELKRFDAPVAFRSAVAAAVRPGSVVIVTPESLQAGSPGRGQTVFEGERSR